ncbi:hypothetical protein LENED_008241 [Lentinula edodes]|uniref:Uncharacterized protein n=1 Tax=Lentinula edodes TaxID=5353 RepID=A0A1Q3EGL0_LENED|nr:hypothetical protein LENED_008241 [Lentinula edodes]
MFQTALHSIFTVVLPRPFFKVTPSKPDPIYYTATAFGTYNLDAKTSFANFNVSMTKFGGTPCTPRRSGGSFLTSASTSTSNIARSHMSSTYCCFCSCPYDISSSSLNREPEFQLLTAVASSLLKSPSPRSTTTKAERRHSLDSHQIASLDSFDSPFKYKSKSQPLEFLQTAKRCSAISEAESPLSSCSSFDASDNEGTYPSTSAPFPLSSPVFLPSRAQNRTQAYSDVNFSPAFELSPIMEDPNTFEDMDDILAYYSDSPVLGRLNESHTHSEFAFDEGDWEPEVILGFETKLKTNSSDMSIVRIIFHFAVLKQTL